MDDFIQFIQNHLLLSGLWLSLVLAIIGLEIWNKRQRPQEIGPQQLVDLLNRNAAKVLDIRSAQQFKQGHILNSKSTPWLAQDEQAFKAYQNEAIILVCQQGIQANQLAQKLKQAGFTEVCVLSGGLQAWQNAQLPMVKGK